MARKKSKWTCKTCGYRGRSAVGLSNHYREHPSHMPAETRKRKEQELEFKKPNQPSTELTDAIGERMTHLEQKGSEPHPVQVRFCPNCGMSLEALLKTGTPTKFCPECGLELQKIAMAMEMM